jgi:hypothetical protein
MFNMQINLQTRQMLVRTLVYFIMVCTFMMVSALIVAPVMAQEGTADEVVVVVTDEATPAPTEEVAATEELVVIPLEDFEQIAIEQFDNAILKIIQSNDLKTVLIVGAFAAFAGFVVFLMYRSSPPDKQLTYVENAQPRVENWRDALRERQEEAFKTDTPFDEILYGGGAALLTEVARLLKETKEELQSQRAVVPNNVDITPTFYGRNSADVANAMSASFGSAGAPVSIEGTIKIDDESDEPAG